MDEIYEQGHQIRALAIRIAALEDNVAFLERWCEEQQDSLDRAIGAVAYDYEVDGEAAPAGRTVLRVVDLRAADGDDDAAAAADDVADDAHAIVAFVDTEHDRRVRPSSGRS
jgi:hypothetical protein